MEALAAISESYLVAIVALSGAGLIYLFSTRRRASLDDSLALMREIIETPKDERAALVRDTAEPHVDKRMWYGGLAICLAGLVGPITLSLLSPVDARPAGQSADRGLPSPVRIGSTWGFLREDTLRALTAYDVGSTVNLEHFMPPLLDQLLVAYRDQDHESVDRIKRMRFLYNASFHPEVANANFLVLRMEETLFIEGGDRRNSATSEQVFELQVDDHPDRQWRTDERFRQFSVKHIIGTSSFTPSEVEEMVSVSWGADVSSLEPTPDSGCWTEPFPEGLATSNSQVIRCTVPLELLERTGGRAVVKLHVTGFVQEHPFSLYSFEPQRFFGGVREMRVLVHSGLSDPQRAREELTAEIVPLGEGPGETEYVRVVQEYNYERDEWDYSFVVQEPRHPVLFSFDH